MSRNKYILLIGLVLVIVLALAFGAQVRRLQTQLRSSVRIVPAEPKSRQNLTENGVEEHVVLAGVRADVLVKFRAGISEAVINEITARFNDRVEDEIEAVPGLLLIDDPDNAAASAIVAQYQGLPEVEYAEPNYEVSLDQAGAAKKQEVNDPQFNEQWWLANISAPQAWSRTTGSKEVVVAVLDTGVEYTHVDLLNNMWTRPGDIPLYQDRDLGTVDDVLGFNVLSNNGDPLDDNGHGTNCAGIISAECGNNLGICGVTWSTKLMPLKFLNAGGFGTVADAIKAINYALDRKRAGVNLRVINVSWGLAQNSRALEEVIRKAGEADILFVVAAGSTSTNNDTSPHYPASYNLGNIISVAAANRGNTLAQFSNYGAKSVNLAAPGEEILTTALGNDYEQRSGTSMATPVVAGVAALALSTGRPLSVDQLRSLLLESVDKLPGLGGKVSTGGRINAARATGR